MKRELYYVTWNGTVLDNTAYPKNLCVTWNRTIINMKHIHKKIKVSLYPKQSPKEIVYIKMGDKCKYKQNHGSGVLLLGGGYAGPFWKRTTLVYHPHSGLNKASSLGCLTASMVEDLNLLVGMAETGIRRKVCTSVEKKKRESKEPHSLFGQKSWCNV